MSNKQQTAVEWQYIELSKFLTGFSEFTHKSDILIKAKEMEKEQKRKDFVDGYTHGDSPLNHSVIDKWYEKTYGGGEQ
jgi:hypothetical protein